MENLFNYICLNNGYFWISDKTFYVNGGYLSFRKLEKVFKCKYEEIDNIIHDICGCNKIICNTGYFMWLETVSGVSGFLYINQLDKL